MAEIIRRKSMAIVLALAMVVSLLPAMTLPAKAADVTTSFSGTLTTENSFKRPDLDSVGGSSADVRVGPEVDSNYKDDPGAIFKSGDNPFNYFTVNFTPAVEGKYTITVTSASLSPAKDHGYGTSTNATDDTTMFIYLASKFDPDNSMNGLMYGQDDIAWSGTSYSDSNNFKSQIASGASTAAPYPHDKVDTFRAGIAYALVLTSYQFDVTGTIDVKIAGPGSVTISANGHTSGYAATPTVTTASVSTCTATTATLGGNVTANGGASVTDRGVVYSSTDATPTIGEDGVTQDTNDSGTGTFSESVSGLTANTTYYVRAYATNTAGTSYGDTVSFKTSALYWKDYAATAYAGGDGTSASPYLISTEAQLAYFSNQVNAGTNYSGKYFKLTTDINLSGKLWTPIGETDQSGYCFAGTFDGNGHVVASMDVVITGSGTDNVLAGLFGVVDTSGTIKNLGIKGEASATSTGSGYSLSGGLAGDNSGTITNCYSQVNVTSTSSGTNAYAGSLVGGCIGTVTNCYATGNTSSSATTYSYAGVLSGDNSGAYNYAYYNSSATVTGTNTAIGTSMTSSEMKDAAFITTLNTNKGDGNSSWAAVMDSYPTFAASATKLSTPGTLAWDGTTPAKATWGAVTNASSYTVQLYKGGVAIGSAVSAANAYYDFTSVITETGSYTFKVTAVGNGATYSNSDASGASAAYSYTAPATKLSTPGTLAWDGTTPAKATWGAVTNASSYTVQLYKGGVAIGSAVSAANAYYDFTSVITETGSYTFKVTAVGNGATYSNSDASGASAAYSYTAPATKLSTPGTLAWDGTTPAKATWGAVTNASSYTVQLYKGGVASGSAVSAANAFYDFTSVITETGSYTFKVTAVGNGATYSNSDASSASAAYSYTAPLYTATVNITIDGMAADVTSVVLKSAYSTYSATRTATTGEYTVSVPDGTYNVYIGGTYAGTSIAIWGTANSATVDYYTVTFDAQGGGAVASQIVLSGGKAAVPAAPALSGFDFKGWYTDTGYGTAWHFNTDTITAARRLHAKWTAASATTYKVTYAAGGAGSGSVPVDGTAYASSATITIKGNTGSLAKAGNTFSGWSDGTTTYTAGQTFTITGNVTLTAQWTPVAVNYTATYSNNYTGGGTFATQDPIPSGTTLSTPSPDPTRTSYTFIGWYKDSACVNPWNFSVDTITANTILYAKWSENIYSVSGTVQDDGAPIAHVSGATVRVMQGNVTFGETVTASDGTFTVPGVPNGTYNLVVTKEDQEVTVYVTVPGGCDSRTITLPRTGNRNSTLEVNGSGTPNVVVDNLNNVFGDGTNPNSVYEQDDINNVNSGGTVEIKLTVQKNDISTNRSQVEAAMTSGGYTSGMVLDVDMAKMVTTSSGEVKSESTIPVIDTLIELAIPLPAELQGKDSYVVTRAHDYGSGIVVDTITTTANAANERIVVSSDKTQLTLYVKYFSTYAIGYTTTSGGGTGGSSEGGSGGDESSSSYYSITVTAGSGGSISPTSASVVSGGSKNFTITPDEGYVISNVLVDGKSVGAIGSYTFSNVKAAHSIKAVFAKESTVWTNPFTDIEKSDWFYDAVKYVSEAGLMGGTSETTFGPGLSTTRGMIVTILWRLDSKPEAADTSSFSDVPTDKYYAKAVAWAEANGIVLGYDDDIYGPDDTITREQLAAILCRCAKYKGYEVTATNDLSAFTDSADISAYAFPAMKWAFAEGLVSGTTDITLSPNGNATRAQVAVILTRFIENVVG